MCTGKRGRWQLDRWGMCGCAERPASRREGRQSTTNECWCWLSFGLWLVLLAASHCLSSSLDLLCRLALVVLSRAWRPCHRLEPSVPWPLKGRLRSCRVPGGRTWAARWLHGARLFVCSSGEAEADDFSQRIILQVCNNARFSVMCGPFFSFPP